MEKETQGESFQEIPLPGGRLTPGIVWVGETVRRQPKGNAPFVHDLLLFLENQSFRFAPRFLGMDEHGREILSYLEGHTWPGSGSNLSDDLLLQAARIIRSYHDATAGSWLAQGHEIVAHHEHAARTGAVKVFEEEVNWMRLRAQELRLALRY